MLRRTHVPQHMDGVKEGDAPGQSEALEFGHGAGDLVGRLGRVNILLIHFVHYPCDPLVEEAAGCGLPD